MPARAPLNDALIKRVNLWLLGLACVSALAALVALRHHGDPALEIPRLAMPLSLLAASLVAVIFGKRGKPGLGVGVILAVTYASILYYVTIGGYGLRSYVVPLYALSIAIAALMIGPRAGLAATAVAIATAALLYWLEVTGMLTGAAAAVALIPLPNILMVYTILFAASGGILYFFSTAYRATLHAASLQERHLRQLIEVTPLGYALHRDGRMLLVNQAAASAAGRPPEALIGVPIDDFIGPKLHLYLVEKISAVQAQTNPKPVVFDCQITDRRGHLRTYETRTVPVTLADGGALLTILLDVTRERAALAEIAAARDAAERANQAKSQFLANMSHEIRTPMNAVLGLSELLLAANLELQDREHAQAIHSSAGALLHVINDVLDVARIEAGKAELIESVFAPAVLLDDLRHMLQPLADAKGLALAVRIDASLPEAVFGDAGRVRQILVNLAGNAIKFTQSGFVRIEAHAVEMMPENGSGSDSSEDKAGPSKYAALHFCVSDSGPGIAPAQLGRLFDRFAQADASSTRTHDGTGLGLYIARHFARLLGGSIEVQSTVGKGSRFEAVLRLRLARPDEMPASVPGRLSTAPEKGRMTVPALMPARELSILLVEDNRVNRMVARAMLADAGHQVSEATDGAQAAAACVTRQFDCVLMDCQMPVMDGFEATRQIRAHEAASDRRRTPVIALTANAMPGNRERCLEAGMDDFLSKPFTNDSLLGAVARAVAGGAGVSDRPRGVSGAGGSDADTGAKTETETLALFDPHAFDSLPAKLLPALIKLFLADTPALAAQVAVAGADARTVARAAHTLGSNCARFGALRATTLARQAEAAAEDGDLTAAHAAGALAADEYARFEAVFRAHPVVVDALGQ